jgi:hypothetical protein
MKARTFFLTIAAIAMFAAPAALAAAPDATMIVRYLAPQSGKYQLEIQNTSEIGFINTFDWVPPAGLTVTAVTKTNGGTCQLASNTITCRGGKGHHGIAPPDCSCHAGGWMTVTFKATGYSPRFNGKYWTYYGFDSELRILSMTPVGYHIPSDQAGVPDLPLCDPGTQPTAEHPCYVE